MSTTNNAMTLPNVRAAETKEPVGEYVVASKLSNLIWELALKNPLWVFKTEKFAWANESVGDGRILVATAFSVYYNSERLGFIGMEYLRLGRGYKISNDRIADSMQRGGFYKTVDEAKAMAKIKKMFKPSSHAEQIEKAEGQANTTVVQECLSKDRIVSKYTEGIRQRAVDYVTKGPGYNLFLEYAKQQGDKTIENSLSMLEIAREELSTIAEIRNAMKAKKSALIIVDEGKYLVKTNDNVQLYDDTTLPIEFRGKLGMLKLVNEKQFITDIGCKVSKEIFVLKLDEQTNQQEAA